MWVLTYDDHNGEKKWVGAGRTGVQECTDPYLGYFYRTKRDAEEAAFWVIYRWKHLIGKIRLERFGVSSANLMWLDEPPTTAIFSRVGRLALSWQNKLKRFDGSDQKKKPKRKP